MLNENDLNIIWSNVAFYLSQRDLTKLSLVSKRFSNVIALPKLYHTIHVTKHPILRSDLCYIDCGTTYISGFRSIIKSTDQNDLFLYDRIERFLETPDEKLKLVKEFIIDNDIFFDRTNSIILVEKLLSKLIGLGVLENIQIKDHELFLRFYEKILKLNQMTYIKLYNFELFDEFFDMPNLESTALLLDDNFNASSKINATLKKALGTQIKTLDIKLDDSCISVSCLFQFFQSNDIKFRSIERLKLNFVHFIEDGDDSEAYSKSLISKFSTVFDLTKIEKLEMEFCCHIDYCDCMDEFLVELAPHLNRLKSVAIKETLYENKGDHRIEENMDVSIGKFLLNVPNVEVNLKELCIRHDPPINGLGVDTVEGNYYRRRKIYEQILPKLKSLERLIVPRMLQSISLYEIIACDLLWNGCTCKHCKEYLPHFDEYLMNHQYYSMESGAYEDIIPPLLFGYCGDILDQRNRNSIDWDLNSFDCSPSTVYWDLHGYERIHHFRKYDCQFNERNFPSLLICISHFFNGYMDHLVKFMPNLRMTLLSGIYYTVADKPLYPYDNIPRRYKSMYD